MTGALTGKVFEAEVRRSLQAFAETHNSFFWMRLSDYRSWIAANKMLVAPKQPADFIAIYGGAVHFFECKSTKSPNGWNTTYLKAHQREALNSVRDAGGRGWILLRDHSTPYHNRAWAVGIDVFEALVSQLPLTRVSVPFLTLDSSALPLPLRAGKIWGLEVVFGDARWVK